MFSSTIKIEGPKLLLEAYKAALAPEQNFRDDRASYSLQLKDTLIIEKISPDFQAVKSAAPTRHYTLNIKITANDATAFRATVTSLAGMLTIVETSWKLCGKKVAGSD